MKLSLPVVLLPLMALSATAQSPQQVRTAIARAAAGQVGVTKYYDPAYVRLAYPGGDIPMERGVCADVIVRALRKAGVDLQVELHKDMSSHFGAYPQIWRLRKPDRNIDHRRVPNLMKFFERKGKNVPKEGPYQRGDIVAWRLSNGLHHIGIVSERSVQGTLRRYMIHNIGAGAQEEDVLRSFQIIGHYRW